MQRRNAGTLTALLLVVAAVVLFTRHETSEAQETVPPVTCPKVQEYPATSVSIVLDGSETTSRPLIHNDCSHAPAPRERTQLQQVVIDCEATTITILITMDKNTIIENVDPGFLVVTKCWPGGGDKSVFGTTETYCNSLHIEATISTIHGKLAMPDRTPIMAGCQALPAAPGMGVG